MPKALRLTLAGMVIALTALGFGLDAQARGGAGSHGGGVVMGGRGGHVALARPGQFRGGFSGYHHRRHWGGRFGHHGRFGRYDRFGYGGGLPIGYGYGYGYGPAPSYDPIYRGESQPAYGIPPSPVLPPAIYVIDDKPGKGGKVSVTRKDTGARIVSVEPRRGKINQTDRRHRMR